MPNPFKNFLTLFSLFTFMALNAFAVTGSNYPSLVLKNQYGETSINSITGGSNQLDCNFIVDTNNGNGLGIRSLKGSACAAVYMHTGATPAAGNPNPAAGYILVQLSKNYYAYVGGYTGFVSPLSGSNINVTSGLTAGLAYVITSVGTTSLSAWQTLGLPAGLTPTVGQSFIAITSSASSGTGVVQLPKATGSGALGIDVVGDVNQSVGATGGAQILLRLLGATGALTVNSYTPAGTITMNSYTPAGTNSVDAPPIFTGTPATLTGTFAGTPATLTGTIASALGIVTPSDNTVIGLRFVMLPLSSQLK